MSIYEYKTIDFVGLYYHKLVNFIVHMMLILFKNNMLCFLHKMYSKINT